MSSKSKVAIGCTLLLIVCTWSCSALLRPHRLREAIRTNDFDTFARLVDESDANSPYKSTVSYTLYLLHAACSDSDERIVRLLLRKGADIHKLDSSGKSCIFHAVGRDDISEQEIADIKLGIIQLRERFYDTLSHRYDRLLSA